MQADQSSYNRTHTLGFQLWVRETCLPTWSRKLTSKNTVFTDKMTLFEREKWSKKPGNLSPWFFKNMMHKIDFFPHFLYPIMDHEVIHYPLNSFLVSALSQQSHSGSTITNYCDRLRRLSSASWGSVNLQSQYMWGGKQALSLNINLSDI